MKENNKIPLYVEDSTGHSTIEVDSKELPERVAEELKDDKWVTIAKNDGSTEILTESDVPCDYENEEEELSEDDKKLKEEVAEKPVDDWKKAFNPVKEGSNSNMPKPTKSSFVKKFNGVKSCTSIRKAKGG